MNIAIKDKKQKAIEFMEILGVYKPYIADFEKDNTVCSYENFGFGGFWVNPKFELMEKIKKVEEKYNCLVYAVTHEYTEFGECYDFLYISDYKEDWDEMLYPQGNMYYAFAYVWNVDDDACSEFGTIGIRSFDGGIKRVA